MPHRAAACAALGLTLALAAAPAPAGPAASGPLDGMTFVATLLVDAYDAPFDDRLSFADGMFFSEECQRRCDFGWVPYHVRQEGDAIAFIAEMTCADAPHHVVWSGRVTGDGIEGEALWTVERFYWTIRRNATFTGARAADAAAGGAVQGPAAAAKGAAAAPSGDSAVVAPPAR